MRPLRLARRSRRIRPAATVLPPMAAHESLTLFFPMWNEEEMIERTVGAAVEIGDELVAAPRRWRVAQTLDDPAGDRAWAITAEVDLDASDEAGKAVVRIVAVGER